MISLMINESFLSHFLCGELMGVNFVCMVELLSAITNYVTHNISCRHQEDRIITEKNINLCKVIQ